MKLVLIESLYNTDTEYLVFMLAQIRASML